jgi:ribA/ribD-fused uncharacterized protein
MHGVALLSWSKEMTKYKYVFFWKSSKEPAPGCLSQWAGIGFVVDGIYYRSAEQYMMAAKARLFNDKNALDKIMKQASPMIMKKIGRGVKGFDGERWAKASYDVVVKGNFAKFSQNEEYGKYLLSTGDAILAEASPEDAIWGIGMKEKEAAKVNHEQWKGKNLLGKALMEVRERLKRGEGDAEEVKENRKLLAKFVEKENSERMRRKEFSKAKAGGPRKKKDAVPVAEKELSPIEMEARDRLFDNDKRSSSLFVATMETLLVQVNRGDQEAFRKFYDLYCPAMLQYLGWAKNGKTEQNQWDIVQMVFTKFYRHFVMPGSDGCCNDSPRRSILAALVKTDKESGRTYRITFRQYLKTCIKNAVREKWRSEEKGGKMCTVSADAKSGPDGIQTFFEKISDTNDRIRIENAEKEKAQDDANALGIWKAVMQGILKDELLSDCTRDVLQGSFADPPVPVSDLAGKWGITENHVYQIKNRNKKNAIELTRAIFKMMKKNGEVIDDDVYRLHKAVAEMKPGRNANKFLVALAKELIKDADKGRLGRGKGRKNR